MTNQNSHDFDPYYKWLGIPPELQPADHYRLLGLRLFEEDREVIAIAADRQMAHIKTFATGKYSRESQSLLDELARAKLCLLNANKKAAYDSALLDELASFEEIATVDSKLQPGMAASLPVPQPVERKPFSSPVPVSNPADSIEINVYGRLRHEKRPARNHVVGWYIFALSLAIIGYVILQLNRREELTRQAAVPQPQTLPHPQEQKSPRIPFLIPSRQNEPEPQPERRNEPGDEKNLPQKPQQDDHKFEGLPTTVDLPAIRDIKITTLCQVPSGATSTLISSDSSLLLSGNRLEWREKGNKDLDLVGELEISTDQLQFRWLKHVPAEAETALRNSLVKLTHGNEVHTSAFRSNEIGEPFHFDLAKPNQRILGNCKHLPDMGRIHFKFLTPNELPPFNGDAIPSAGLQYSLAMDMNFLGAANVKTHFEIDRVGNVPRVKLETKFQLPSGESRPLTFKHLRTAHEVINYELNAIDFETNRLKVLLKKPPAGQHSAIQEAITGLEEQRKIVVADQIELDRVAKVAEALDGRLLPYRFYTVVDEYEVDLILAK